MKTTSNFVPIDNFWGLIEYSYNTSILPVNEVGLMRVKNMQDDSILFFNHPIKLTEYSEVYRKTNNVFDTNAVLTHSNSVDNSSVNSLEHYIQLHSETNTEYYETIYNELLFENINEILKFGTKSDVITYDSIKIHILQGYNFDQRNGFLIKVAYSDGVNTILATQNVFTKQDVLQYHNRPFRINDSMYDRYYEIKIPKLSDLIDYNNRADETQRANIMAKYGKDLYEDFTIPMPDITKSNIYITLYDIVSIEYDSNLLKEIKVESKDNEAQNSITQLALADQFNGIFAEIHESEFGDYFEYYAGYNDEYISDWIANIASPKSEFILYHTLAVFEHIDNNRLTEEVTQLFTMEQSTNYDKPFYFRPVIINDDCNYFTIEYYIKLVDINGECPSEIIRKSSLTYPNAKKYGRYLQKLNVNTNNQVKIYNKIINNTNLSNSNQQSSQINYNIKQGIEFNPNPLKSSFLIPVHYNNICIEQNITTLPAQVTGLVKFGDGVFKQNDLEIGLNKFNNLLIFDIIHKQNDQYINYELNRTSFIYKLYLKDVNNNDIILEAKDPNAASEYLNSNRLVFDVDSSTVSKLLTGSTFNIVMCSYITKIVNGISFKKTDFETVMYTGKIKLEN